MPLGFGLIKLLLVPVRWMLGLLVLAYDRLASVQALTRPAAGQARVDAETASLTLYQFETCPFCVKVRRQIRRLGLKIELRDARRDSVARQELLAGGGELQVPCLRITSGVGGAGGETCWMYESSDINEYLAKRFG